MLQNGRKSLLVFAVILFGSSWTAWACERSLELDSEQVRHHVDLLKSTDADELDQIDVMGVLMCAERTSIRDLAARTALASPNESVQAGMLSEVLMQKKSIFIEFIEEEGISNEVRDYVQENIAVNYQAKFVDHNASCIGLDNNSCENYFLDITGKNVEIKYGSDIGSFSLDQNGDLRGFFKPFGAAMKIPARIQLL
ncbi:MAG: hypothetical protein ACR2QH_04730 [Geminicoccaceae bacterium]